jgi:CheY-like chemotaxis protein
MHLLIVEDDEKTARALASGLERAGFATTTAQTGEDGFFLLNPETTVRFALWALRIYLLILLTLIAIKFVSSSRKPDDAAPGPTATAAVPANQATATAPTNQAAVETKP